MRRNKFVLPTSALLALTTHFAFGPSFFSPTPAAAQSASEAVVLLNQAWSQDDREWFYHFRKVRRSFPMTSF
jgi:hypothetical protein